MRCAQKLHPGQMFYAVEWLSDMPYPTQPVGSKVKTRHQIFSFPPTPSAMSVAEYLLEH